MCFASDTALEKHRIFSGIFIGLTWKFGGVACCVLCGVWVAGLGYFLQLRLIERNATPPRTCHVLWYPSPGELAASRELAIKKTREVQDKSWHDVKYRRARPFNDTINQFACCYPFQLKVSRKSKDAYFTKASDYIYTRIERIERNKSAFVRKQKATLIVNVLSCTEGRWRARLRILRFYCHTSTLKCSRVRIRSGS